VLLPRGRGDNNQSLLNTEGADGPRAGLACPATRRGEQHDATTAQTPTDPAAARSIDRAVQGSAGPQYRPPRVRGCRELATGARRGPVGYRGGLKYRESERDRDTKWPGGCECKRRGIQHRQDAELADVQRLARQAVRDVREVVAGGHAPSVDAELAAAEAALHLVGIQVSVDNIAASIDPAHETTIAWALREAVTNVVKHSGARTCRIALDAANGCTTLDVDDDGHGPVGEGTGTGLEGPADRIGALGGTLEVGPRDGSGFRVGVRLGAAVPPRPTVELAP
jgi:hypothetical protein